MMTRQRENDKPTSMREYKQAVAAYSAEHPEQRPGQAHFNVLAAMDMQLADQVRGTELDTFYRNARIPDFLTWLERQAFGAPTAELLNLLGE